MVWFIPGKTTANCWITLYWMHEIIIALLVSRRTWENECVTHPIHVTSQGWREYLYMCSWLALATGRCPSFLVQQHKHLLLNLITVSTCIVDTHKLINCFCHYCMCIVGWQVDTLQNDDSKQTSRYPYLQKW